MRIKDKENIGRIKMRCLKRKITRHCFVVVAKMGRNIEKDGREEGKMERTTQGKNGGKE